MKRSFFLLLMLWVAAPAFADNSIELGDPDTKKWIAERVENAAKGKREMVQAPLVIRSEGWGCVCPGFYLGDSPNVGSGLWVDPVWGTLKPPAFDKSEGIVLVVEGYFTGKTRKQTWKTEEYLVSEMKITKVRKASEDIYTSGESTITLLMGALQIVASGPVEIELDGKKVGTAPLLIEGLLVGEHTVKACKDGYGCYEQRVKIEKDKTFSLDLKKKKL